MEQSDRRSSLPRLPWIQRGYSASPNALITTRTTGTLNISAHSGGLPAQTTLKQTACAPVTGAHPLVFLLHDYLTQRQVWPLTSALFKLLKHPSNKPHFYHSSIAVVEYLCIYLCTILRSLFIIVYLFMYLFIYWFCFLFSALWILNCRWTLKMLLFNETLYMHDSAVEGF